MVFMGSKKYQTALTKKRGYGRKKSYRSKRGPNYMNMAKQALQTAKWVATLVNAEFKYDTTSIIGGISDDTTGSIQTVCNPAQGTSVTQREGDSIKMKNLTLRGQFDQSNAMNNNSVCRIIVLIDKENAITTLANLLQITGNANVVNSPKLEDTKYDSRILLDKTYVTSLAYPIRQFDEVITIDEHTHFTAGTATVANNALKIFAFSNIGVVTAPLVNYLAKVTYLDN